MKSRISIGVSDVRVPLSAGMVLLLAIAGCDKPMSDSSPSTKLNIPVSVNSPAGNTAAEVAAYKVLPPSVLSVGGREVTFPAAKLAVIGQGDGTIPLRLCTDDPPSAIDPGYLGNSYLFDMQLPIDRIDQLPAAQWDRKASDAKDSTSGIFIHGFHHPLLPADMHVTFQKNGSELLTCITGTFLCDDNENPGASPRQVQVNGGLHTQMPTD